MEVEVEPPNPPTPTDAFPRGADADANGGRWTRLPARNETTRRLRRPLSLPVDRLPCSGRIRDQNRSDRARAVLVH